MCFVLTSIALFLCSYRFITFQRVSCIIISFLSTGACGYLPEHSLQAHQLAIDLGTDYVEPDLCMSKDLVLMVMHDSTLDETTNIRDHPGGARHNSNINVNFKNNIC